jgi:hypothetical protein
MIDKSKQYRTRDGREVRIYATDGDRHAPIHGAISHPDGSWTMLSWLEDGGWCKDHETNFDLIEVRPRHKRTVWLNVYDGNPMVQAFKDRTLADNNAWHSRIACIKVDLDFQEGEGL